MFTLTHLPHLLKRARCGRLAARFTALAPSRRRLRLLLVLLQVAAVVATMAASPPFQAGYCDLYNTVVTWIRTAAGILTVLAILYLGGTKLASAIIPDIGVRTGYVIVGIAVGLILVAFGQDIAGAVIDAFGLPAVAC